MNLATDRPRRDGAWRAAAVLTTPAVFFWVPFLGPWLSIVAVVVAVPYALRGRWAGEGRRGGRLRLLGVAALWWPAVLVLVFWWAFGDRLGGPETSDRLVFWSGLVEQTATVFWLLLPLGGPEDMVTPAAAATGVLAAGAGTSVLLGRAWPWVLGAAAAPLAYALVVQVLDIAFYA